MGGYAVILHGYNRTTGDLDIWVEPTAKNYAKLMAAFAAFDLPTNLITEEIFLDTAKNDVFTFGRSPNSIDIMTAVKGLNFAECLDKSILFPIEPELNIRLIGLDHLIKAKRASGRHRDLDDIEHLLGEE